MKFKFRVIGKNTGEQCFEEYFIDSRGVLYRQCEMDGSISTPTDREDLVVQYATGLLDVGGKEIFEGDIVAWEEIINYGHPEKQTRKAQIVFSPTVSAFVLDVNGRHLFDDKYGDYQHLHKETKYKITNK